MKEDLVEATKYLLRLKLGDGTIDDIDHLGSRRVRTVGELWPTNVVSAWPDRALG